MRSPVLAASRASRAAIVMLEPNAILEPAAVSPPMTFEAQGDPLQAAILIGAIALPFAYWWFVTVPEARLALAKDKRLQGGETKAYLDELADDPSARPVERWFFSKWLRQKKPTKEAGVIAETSAEDKSKLQTPLEAGEAQPVTIKELFRPASLKGNATPKFWSGDNPIVVTMAGLAACGVFATAAQSNTALAVDGLLLTVGLVFGLSRLTLD